MIVPLLVGENVGEKTRRGHDRRQAGSDGLNFKASFQNAQFGFVLQVD